MSDFVGLTWQTFALLARVMSMLLSVRLECTVDVIPSTNNDIPCMEPQKCTDPMLNQCPFFFPAGWHLLEKDIANLSLVFFVCFKLHTLLLLTWM